MALKCMILKYNPDKEIRHQEVEKAVKEYLGDSACVQYSSKGKPSIVGTETKKYISVTTTGDIILVAINDSPIGIDGEYLPRYAESKSQFGQLAERFMSGDEADYIRGDSGSEKDKFLRVWIRKEAYVKCVDKGVTDFPSFSVVDGEKFVSKVGSIKIRKFSIQFEGCENYIFAIAGI